MSSFLPTAIIQPFFELEARNFVWKLILILPKNDDDDNDDNNDNDNDNVNINICF